MKATKIISGALAVALAAGSAGAFARDHDGRGDGHRHDSGRHNGWQQQAHRQQWQHRQQPDVQQRDWQQQRSWQGAYRNYTPPAAYAYNAPHYRWNRGDRLPGDWRGRYHVVNNWGAYNLYAPPSGYQWVQSDAGDYLLVALATGLIANLLMNNY